MRKVLENKDVEENEKAYMESLICSVEIRKDTKALKLVDAVLLNIFAWCGSKLDDYHLHFIQVWHN